MKNLGITLIFIYLSINIQAQVNDTTWLNIKWVKTTKDSARYYRISKYNSINQRYTVKDYFLTGKLQMSGRYISLSPKIKDGIFKWYYPNKTIEHRYINNKVYRIIEWNKDGKIIRDKRSKTLYS